jgi:hypothetical protein
MGSRVIMILEDNEERIHCFQIAIQSLPGNYEFLLWRTATEFMDDCHLGLPNPCLISLDHDLAPKPGADWDPGDGLQVAEFLGKRKPVCPVIIHTSNTERRWSMHNELRFGKWQTEIILPIGPDWIYKSWLPTARRMIGV